MAWIVSLESGKIKFLSQSSLFLTQRTWAIHEICICQFISEMGIWAPISELRLKIRQYIKLFSSVYVLLYNVAAKSLQSTEVTTI